MREVVRCSGCSECSKVTPCGFASVPYLFCTSFGQEVDADDGCTFGSGGSPTVGVVAHDVYLAAHPCDFQDAAED